MIEAADWPLMATGDLGFVDLMPTDEQTIIFCNSALYSRTKQPH